GGRRQGRRVDPRAALLPEQAYCSLSFCRGRRKLSSGAKNNRIICVAEYLLCVLKLHRVRPQLAGHSTASRRAKEAGSRTVVRCCRMLMAAHCSPDASAIFKTLSRPIKVHRSVQPQADDPAL